MREYVDRTWGWGDEDQATRFRKAFEPQKLQIIEANGERIGSWRIAREAERVILEQIEIAPQNQSRGIGTQLVRELSTEADSARLPIELQVLKVNPARRLYERLGFGLAGQTATHYSMRRVPGTP